MSERRMLSVRKWMSLSTSVDAWVGVEGRAEMIGEGGSVRDEEEWWDSVWM